MYFVHIHVEIIYRKSFYLLEWSTRGLGSIYQTHLEFAFNQSIVNFVVPGKGKSNICLFPRIRPTRSLPDSPSSYLPKTLGAICKRPIKRDIPR